jgi:hypothetical protein
MRRKKCFIVTVGKMLSAVRKSLMPRLARWFIFKPKIPTWVNFGGP